MVQRVTGQGLREDRRDRAVAGTKVPDFTNLAYGLVLRSDATVADDGAVVGDPTELALVVLAAKLGVDAEHTTGLPEAGRSPVRLRVQVHVDVPPVSPRRRRADRAAGQGGPDVVLARCSTSGRIVGDERVSLDQTRESIEQANAEMGGQGLRVLAFAARIVEEAELEQMQADPMSLTNGLSLIGLVGIIDPCVPGEGSRRHRP